MSVKIAFLGAGSVTFARKLFTDLMSVPELRDSEIAFCDIDPENLEMVTKLCQQDLDKNGVDIKIQPTTDRRVAFKGAKYIINCVRIGGLEAFATDVEIPLKYGVDQCVGDTLCIGGILYGQRVIAAMREICEDIKELAHPDALHLNYSNPNAMATWACNTFFGVRTIGLCHGVVHGQEQIAEILGVDYDELDVICAGLNHQTWYLSVRHKGVELRHKLLEGFLNHPRYSQEEKVRIDILKRFGYYSTESNGHLSEYVSWYRKRPEEISSWIDLSDWIHGQTAGYLRHCTENRNWFLEDFPHWMAGEPNQYDGSQRSREHGSYIIEGLETGRRYRGHFNVINNGCIGNLADDCVVEVPCYVDGNGISVPRVGDLPLGCAAICAQTVSVQRMAVYAAVNGDVQLLKQAALMDPLTGAVCNPPEVWQMVDEMLIAQEQWLPQYREEIEQAKARWEEGNLIPTRNYKGAARLEVQSIEQIKADPNRTGKPAS